MTAKEKKIILTGTYSSFNKGDAAMQLSTAQSLRKMWPDADIVISSPFPQYDKSAYSEFRVIKSSRRNLIIGSLQVLRAWKYKILHNYFRIRLNFLINNSELKEFSTADLVIDLSGDMLTESHGPHLTYSHFLPICLALAFNKPVFVCAQSIGPFKLTKPFAKRLLNKVSQVTVRENITFDYLKNMGMDPKKVQITADMAFLLEPSSKQRVDSMLKNEGIGLKGHTLGITVSSIVEKRFNKSHDGKNFIKEIAAMLDQIIDSLDISVLFVGHVTGPSEQKDDRLTAKRVHQAMKNQKKAFVLNGNYRPDELKGVIARCDVFIGARMHSNIAALSTTVPTLAIGYSHKTQGIMSSAGMSKYVYNIDNLDTNKIYKDLVSVYKNRTHIANDLKKSATFLKAESRKNLDIIRELTEASV